MPTTLLDTILTESYTQNEALIHLRALKDLVLVQLFGQSSPQNLKNISSSGQQTSWLTSLPKDFLKNFTRKNVYQLFNELETEIKKIPILTLFVPFEIPTKEFASLGQYLRKNYGKNFLAEVKIDPSLIAGCALVWNGVYKDYSIRKKIADNREIILAKLKDYIKH